MHFATALEQTVKVVVYGEFKAVLEIGKGRNIIYIDSTSTDGYRPYITTSGMGPADVSIRSGRYRHCTRSRLYVTVRFRVQYT